MKKIIFLLLISYQSFGQIQVTLTNSNAAPDSSSFVNVLNTGADNTGTTSNYAAFTLAIANLPAKGGTLIIPAGTYLIDTTVVINKQIKIVGDGKDKNFGSFASTRIVANTNIDVWKITSAGVKISDIGWEWTGASNPTSARAIYVYNTDTDVSPNMPTTVSQKLTLRDVSVRGFYDNIVIDKCAYWMMDNLVCSAPIRYGLFIQNLTKQDAGGWTIANSMFWQPPATPGGYGLYQIGSGGGKINNSKFNGAFDYCIYDSMPNSSILLINNTNFENFGKYAIYAVSLNYLNINNGEFAAYSTVSPSFIYLSNCIANITNNHFVGTNSSGVAINFVSGSGQMMGNNFYNFASATPYTIPTSIHDLSFNSSGTLNTNLISKYTVKSGDPTTTNIPDGYTAVYKNSTTGSVYLWANVGGTLIKVQLQ